MAESSPICEFTVNPEKLKRAKGMTVELHVVVDKDSKIKLEIE